MASMAGDTRGGTRVDLTRLLVRSDLRRRWRSWLTIVVLVGVIGGLSMAAVAGWRRTNSAMERFFEYHQAANGYTEGSFEADEVEAIPGVEAAVGRRLLPPGADRRRRARCTRSTSGRSAPSRRTRRSMYASIEPADHRGRGAARPVGGERRWPSTRRWPSSTTSRPATTSRCRATAWTRSSSSSRTSARWCPPGSVFDFTVTGILRSPQDVVPHQKVPDVVYMGSAEVLLGPAFDAAHRRVDVPSLGALFGDAGPAGASGLELRDRLLGDDARGRHRRDRRAGSGGVRRLQPPATPNGPPRRPAGRSGCRPRSSWRSARWWRSVGSCSSPRRCAASSTPTAMCSARSRALGATRSSAVRVAAVKSALVARRERGGGRGRRDRALAAHAGGPRPPRRDRSGGRRRRDRAGARGVGAGGAGRGLRGRQRLAQLRRRAARSRSSSGACGLSDRAAQAGMPPSVVAGVRAAGLGAGGTDGPRHRVRGGARDRRRPRLRRERGSGSPPTPTSGAGPSTRWSGTATTRPRSSGRRRRWPATR